MTVNSKLEARNDAVRIAAMLKDVDSTNIVEVSEKIEKYMLGSVDIPEVYDPYAYMREIQDMLKTQISDRSNKVYNSNTDFSALRLGIASEPAKEE